MTDSTKFTELPSGSIKISTQRRMVRIDDATEETEQSYLTIESSPDGFRWLAQYFDSLAISAEKGGHCGSIIAPWDFTNKPIELDGWDSIECLCKGEPDV